MIVTSLDGDDLELDLGIEEEADGHNADTFGEGAEMSSEEFVIRPPPSINVQTSLVGSTRPSRNSQQRREKPFLKQSERPAIQIKLAEAMSLSRPKQTRLSSSNTLLAPFTRKHKERAILGEKIDLGSSNSTSGNSGLMTSSDQMNIMNIHLTSISAQSSKTVQDWRGTFRFAAANAPIEHQATAGKRLYASVHHPRRNIESSPSIAAAPDISSSDSTRVPLQIEVALALILEIEDLDTFISTLHPLAIDQLEQSYQQRLQGLQHAWKCLSGDLNSVAAIQKGKYAINRILRSLLIIFENNSIQMRIKRVSDLSASIDLLDSICLEIFTTLESTEDLLLVECMQHLIRINKIDTPCIRWLLNIGATTMGMKLKRNSQSLLVIYTALVPFMEDMDAIVQCICETCVDIYNKLDQKDLDKLWNLLIAILGKANNEQHQTIQTHIGHFIEQKLA
jgi:hypothetical protein